MAQFMWSRALARWKTDTPENRAAFESKLMAEVATIGTRPFNGKMAEGARVRRHYEQFMRAKLNELFGFGGRPAFPRKPVLAYDRKAALLASLESLERKAEVEKIKLIDPPF